MTQTISMEVSKVMAGIVSYGKARKNKKYVLAIEKNRQLKKKENNNYE